MSTATETAPRTRNVGPSQIDFVKAYMEVYKQGGTNKDLAEKLRMTVSSVIARAKGYKQRNVNLPDLKVGQRGRKVNTDPLNELIASLLRGEENAVAPPTGETS